MIWRRGEDADRGSVALETAVLAPPMLLLIGMAVVGLRVQDAKSVVEAAAHDAARAASISRTPAAAQAEARSAAQIALNQQGLRCARTSVQVDTSEFSRPVGQPANVYVTVSCDVSLGDLSIPILPGTRTLRAEFISPLDVYRARQ